MKKILNRFKDKRFLSAFLSTLLITFTFCVFGPLELFLTNHEEFWFSLFTILPIVILCFIISFFILFLIIGFFEYMWILVSITFGLGVAFYIQGNFMFINYGTLDGRKIDWSSYNIYGTFNSFIWIAILIGCIILYGYKEQMFHKLVKFVTILVLSIQTLTLVFLIVNTPNSTSRKDYVLTSEDMLKLSNNKNIVVFILDCFESSIFKNLTETNPEYKELFKDFIYYPDTVAGASRTPVSIPQILTGYTYLADSPYSDYISWSYNKTNFFDTLKENNYVAEIYTDLRYVSTDLENKIENLKEDNLLVTSYSKLANYLYTFTGFKYAPHYLKNDFWIFSNVFESVKTSEVHDPYIINDSLFFKSLMDTEFEIDNEKNHFKFYHLFGAHAPYTLNSEAQSIDESTEIEQIKGVFKIVEEYINILKSNDTYDNTAFFIMSDHGSRGLSANPIFMVKDFDTSKNFEVSQAPLSYVDLIPTWNYLITQDYSTERTIFDITEDEERERYFYLGEGSYFQMDEYMTTQKAWENENFILKNKYTLISPYELGDMLYFNNTETANRYFLSGLSSNTNSDSTWTSGSTVELSIPFKKVPANDLILELNYEQTAKLFPRIEIYINDDFIERKTLYQRTFNLVIPKEYIKDNRVDIRFEILDINDDKLGISLKHMIINDINKYTMPKDIEKVYKVDLDNISFSDEDIKYNANNYKIDDNIVGITGWCFKNDLSSKEATVDVYLYDELSLECYKIPTEKIQRSDVANVFKNQLYELSGYSAVGYIDDLDKNNLNNYKIVLCYTYGNEDSVFIDTGKYLNNNN